MKYKIVKFKGEYSIEKDQNVGYNTMKEAKEALEKVKEAQAYSYGDQTNYKKKNQDLMEEMRREDNERTKRSYRL